MKRTLSIAAASASFLLAACGGGGGATAPTPTPTPTPAPPVVVVPPPYTLTPATLTTSHVVGYPATVILNGKQTVPFVGVAFIKVDADAGVIDPVILVTPKGDGTFDVAVKTAAGAGAGSYTGNITVNACLDANCVLHMAGSPFKLLYRIDIVSAGGSLTAYNQPALSPLAGAPDWETFQANARHTGYVPVTLAPAAFNPRWKWQAPAFEGQQIALSTIATGAGRLYVANGTIFQPEGSSVSAFSEHDGSMLWNHSFLDLAYPSTNPPAFSNGRVFISAGSQHVTAMFGFDAASGAQIFKTPMTSQWEHYLAPTVFDGKVYTNGGAYGGMYGFAAATGTRSFFTSGLGQFDGWTPAVEAQNAYAYVGGSLHVIDPASGVVRASIADPGHNRNGYTSAGAPVIGANGMVFAGNLNSKAENFIVAFDTVAKSVRWHASGPFSGNPGYADGLLFAPNNGTGKLEVYKEQDGAIDWSWSAPASDKQFVSDVLVIRNLVFVSTTSTTYAIDRTTHATVYSTKASGMLAISANGILYIKDKSALVAINLK